MANINLLPWREAQRRERNQMTLVVCVAMWGVACLIVFAGKLFMDSRIEYQHCLLYTSPSPRDLSTSRMPSSA